MVDDAMKMQCFLLLCAVISVSLAEDNCTGRAQKDLCGDLCVFNCVCGAYPNNQTLEANVSHKKWCCAEPGTCSLTAKDNGISRSSTATCTTGVIQPLSVPCNGHCNDHRPLIDRGDRTYLMCDSGDQCVGEHDICQGKPLLDGEGKKNLLGSVGTGVMTISLMNIKKLMRKRRYKQIFMNVKQKTEIWDYFVHLDGDLTVKTTTTFVVVKNPMGKIVKILSIQRIIQTDHYFVLITTSGKESLATTGQDAHLGLVGNASLMGQQHARTTVIRSILCMKKMEHRLSAKRTGMVLLPAFVISHAKILSKAVLEKHPQPLPQQQG